MGRLPLPGVQGRRRGRARQPQHQAADPLLPRGRRGDARAAAGRAASSTASSSWPCGATTGSTGSSSRRCRSGSTRPRAGSTCSRRRRRPGSWPSTCSRSATTSYVDRPFAERRAALEQALAGLDGPCFLTRTTTRPGAGRGVVPPVRGRRARRRGRQAAGRAVRRERPHHAQDQARAHRRRGRRRLPRAQDQHARAAAARQPAPRSVRRRRAAAHRGQRQLHRGTAGRADRAAPAAGRARSRSTRGVGGRSS